MLAISGVGLRRREATGHVTEMDLDVTARACLRYWSRSAGVRWRRRAPYALTSDGIRPLAGGGRTECERSSRDGFVDPRSWRRGGRFADCAASGSRTGLTRPTGIGRWGETPTPGGGPASSRARRIRSGRNAGGAWPGSPPGSLSRPRRSIAASGFSAAAVRATTTRQCRSR